MIKINAIDKLREATKNGCRYMTFLYQSKGTGETSKYQINFGVDYHNACMEDKAILEAYTPQDDLEIEAKDKMLQSLTETLVDGVSASYTQKDLFEVIGKGIRQHKETNELYVWGFVEKKEQIEPPTNPRKPVNSRPLTLAKRKIEKACDFKRLKFGQFILNPERIAGIATCGEVIELH
jgi:hypothetical protein